MLLHGLGRTLIDWSVIGPLLAAHFRTVAVDIRGHGHSGDGPWSWDLALGDVEAAATELQLGTPSVVGHSLGGILAVMWGRTRPGTPVVNIDGHGRRALAQYEGIDENDARRRIAQADDRVRASLNALSGPLPPAVVEELLAQQRVLASRFGAPQDMFVQSIERTLSRSDKGAFLRPSPVGLGAKMLASAESFDMFGLYADMSGPVLVMAGTDPDPSVDPELMAAYRRGLRRDLERVAAEHSNVRIEFRRGGHGLLFEDAEGIASSISTFLVERRTRTTRPGAAAKEKS